MAENSIFGPQLGLRWFRQRGRWTISAEGRGFFAVNRQKITGGYPIQEATPSGNSRHHFEFLCVWLYPWVSAKRHGSWNPRSQRRLQSNLDPVQPCPIWFPTRGWCTPTTCISGSGHRPETCGSTPPGKSPNHLPWRRAGNGCTSPTVLPGGKAMGQGTHSRVSTTRT